MMVNVFEQCQSLLSPMSHYDFHLRTALATVNEAVALRDRALAANTATSTLTLEEADILSRAIRRVLTPYITNAVGLSVCAAMSSCGWLRV